MRDQLGEDRAEVTSRMQNTTQSLVHFAPQTDVDRVMPPRAEPGWDCINHINHGGDGALYIYMHA